MKYTVTVRHIVIFSRAVLLLLLSSLFLYQVVASAFKWQDKRVTRTISMEPEHLATPPSVTVTFGYHNNHIGTRGFSDLERPISDDIIDATFSEGTDIKM